MADLLTLMDGAEVECTDGNRARLERTLVDSTTKRLRHLAVEAPGSGSGRLVPISHLQHSADRVALDCSSAELEAFDLADLPRSVPDTMAAATGSDMQERIVFTHNIPDGEVEVRTGEEVRADNARLGRLLEMIVNPDDGSIERLVVSVGHLFSKRELAVPASFVVAFEGGTVRIAGSKRQVMNRLAA